MRHLIVVGVLLCLCWHDIHAQEALLYGKYNIPQKNTRKDTHNLDTLSLPFFDDFSNYTGFPDSKRWADRCAFVNTSYPQNPPSIGVATLDALDAKGNLHRQLYDVSFVADTLTSLPIDAAFPATDNVYLSFYYEPEGYGDAPELADSLLLDFYTPQTNQWQNVWYAQGDSTLPFTQVILPITDTRFLQKGFRFRFRNRVSLSGSLRPGMASNADFWHIDYVYLNRKRTANDTVAHDIAFTHPMQSLIEGYEAMPWQHYKSLITKNMKKSATVGFKNNDNVKRRITRMLFSFTDLYQQQTKLYDAGSFNIQPLQSDIYPANIQSPNFTYEFPVHNNDSALFEVRCTINTDSYDPKANNEVVYVQNFNNYYAYDDGSAEVGYGLMGEGTRNARFALQFKNLKPNDTLRAVQFYFNRTVNNMTSNLYFYLTVWTDSLGKPGRELYKISGMRPRYADSLNKFVTYPLLTYDRQNDTAIAVPETFYVGWTQVKEEILNVGFDFNRISTEKSFFNIGGEWKQSEKVGTAMIRPVFGNARNRKSSDGNSHAPILQNTEVQVYPNPAQDKILLQNIPNTDKPIKVTIFDTFGRTMYQNLDWQGEVIDVSGFASGIYYVKATDAVSFLSRTPVVVQ